MITWILTTKTVAGDTVIDVVVRGTVLTGVGALLGGGVLGAAGGIVDVQAGVVPEMISKSALHTIDRYMRNKVRYTV